MKTCRICHETKPFDQFTWAKNPRYAAGGYYVSRCKTCAAAKTKAWYAENKDRALTQQATWRDTNRDQWNCRMRTAGSKRRAAKLQRVPAWYDQAKVQEIYELAAEFREAGFDVDVDHIVPLQAVEASGLHWHGNLRVCLASHNRSKRNEMPLHHGALATPEQKLV